MFGQYLIKTFAGKKRYQHVFESLGNIANSVRYIGYSKIESRYLAETYYIDRLFADAKIEHLNIFDVGANIGDYSNSIKELATVHKKSFKVFAFEPAKKTFARLAERFAGNSDIVCVNTGLSNAEGEAILYSDSASSDLASIYNLEGAYRKFNDDFKEIIKLDTVDLFVSKHGIDVIDYLKIDAEGHDYYVLKGAEQTLKERKIL